MRARIAAIWRAVVHAPRHFLWRIRRRLRRRDFTTEPISSFAERHGAPTLRLLDAGSCDVPGPKFAPGPYQVEVPERVQVSGPAIEAVMLEGASVWGGLDMVGSGSALLHPDVVDPMRDITLAEREGVAAFVKAERRFLLWPGPGVMRLPAAVSLVGEYTGNYAHFMLETLPKLIMLDACEQFDDLPLIVDGWIHNVFFEALMLLNHKARPIHRLGRWDEARVDRLLVISAPSYTPELRSYAETRIVPAPSQDYYRFNSEALTRTRKAAVLAAKRFVSANTGARMPDISRIHVDGDYVVSTVGGGRLGRDKKYFARAKRVYLRRVAANAGNPRSILGEDRVEDELARRGFVAVNPAELSFPEQVLLLQDAEVVVSPVGAALINLMFAPPGRAVIALAPYYRGVDYFYFSNLMGVLGHNLRFVLGPQVADMHLHHQHRNYMVDLAALRAALDELRCS